MRLSVVASQYCILCAPSSAQSEQKDWKEAEELLEAAERMLAEQEQAEEDLPSAQTSAGAGKISSRSIALPLTRSILCDFALCSAVWVSEIIYSP